MSKSIISLMRNNCPDVSLKDVIELQKIWTTNNSICKVIAQFGSTDTDAFVINIKTFKDNEMSEHLVDADAHVWGNAFMSTSKSHYDNFFKYLKTLGFEETAMKQYMCNGIVYKAKTTNDAWIMALETQGKDALESASVKGVDNNSVRFGVCLAAYRRAFPEFTDDDFVNYELVSAKAWRDFEKIVNEDEGSTSLSADGIAFIQANSNLARYMKDIHFRW